MKEGKNELNEMTFPLTLNSFSPSIITREWFTIIYVLLTKVSSKTIEAKATDIPYQVYTSSIIQAGLTKTLVDFCFTVQA